jgi:DNA-binding transcriptional MerR regulator
MVVDSPRGGTYLHHIDVVPRVFPLARRIDTVERATGDTVTNDAERFTETWGYTGKRAAEIVGITYRQLDYWARTDLIRPSVADAAGSGSRRSYSYQDLLELKVIKTLLDAGIRLETVRGIFEYMRNELGEDVASANLVIQGHTSVLVRSGEEIIDLIQKGQGVLNVLPLAGVKQDLDASIVNLYPDGDAAEVAIAAAR